MVYKYNLDYINKRHPKWELFKIGSSSDYNSRKKTLEDGINEIKEFKSSSEKISNNQYNEHKIFDSFKLTTKSYPFSISPFIRVIGGGRTYKVNPIIMDIDKKLFYSLKEIADIKTIVYSKLSRYASSWGYSEFLLRKCN